MRAEAPAAATARVEHVGVWARDDAALERLRTFYETYFGARSGARYASARRPGFASYFLTHPGGGARLELMTVPGLAAAATDESIGYAHVAIALGSREAVDAMARRMARDGVVMASAPRVTGDGYYEAVVRDPEGNHVEIMA